MKKKLALVVVLILLIIFGVLIFKLYTKKDEISNLENNDDIVVIESNDLFGKYYPNVEKIVKNMSLDEKVGQLFLIRYDKEEIEGYIRNYYAGGFVLFAKDFEGHNKDSIKEELDYNNSISNYPLTFAVDEEGGYVTRVSRFSNFRDSKFLAPKYYYEIGGYDLLKEVESEKAKLLLSLGINLNLAPVADISVNKNDFIYSRSFGYDATTTSEFIRNMVGYAKDEGISSCLKHFPGYGNNVDTHTGIAIDDREYSTFTTSDYLPFISGIEASVPCILVSHNVINSIDSEYPASLSEKVITKELREKLGFSGIVITDDLDMDAIDKYTEDGRAATLAINAGVDLIITSDFVSMYNEIVDGVRSNTIDIEKIDKAVIRVLAWKQAYGLF